MLSFPIPGGKFSVRTVAVVLHGDRVLIHRMEHDDFWSLPGGRVEFGEPAAAALARELHEELGVEAGVGRLLWLAENFFALGGHRYHELSFYFDVALPPACPLYEVVGPFCGNEPHLPLIYCWMPVAAMAEVTLQPAFLRTGLLALPSQLTHVVVGV